MSLIGGEFFQGQICDSDVNDAFFEMIHKISELYRTKIIDSVWITATLALGDQEDLYKTLRTFEGVMTPTCENNRGIWLCTSWDPEGRFRTRESEAMWRNHMKKIASDFPWVRLNTTIILTQKFCKMYLNGDFDPKKFMLENNTSLAFTQTRIYDLEEDVENARTKVAEVIRTNTVDEFLTDLKSQIEKEAGFRFFPERKTFRRFLLKLAKEDEGLFKNLFNLNHEPAELHKNYANLEADEVRIVNEETKLEACSIVGEIPNPNCNTSSDGQRHVIDYATYSDSNACMICDYEQIKKSLEH